MVRASDLRLSGREFDHRPPHYRSVVTGMGDRLRYVNIHPGQLNLLPLAGRKMNTGQRAMKLCGWDVKTDMTHTICG